MAMRKNFSRATDRNRIHKLHAQGYAVDQIVAAVSINAEHIKYVISGKFDKDAAAAKAGTAGLRAKEAAVKADQAAITAAELASTAGELSPQQRGAITRKMNAEAKEEAA